MNLFKMEKHLAISLGLLTLLLILAPVTYAQSSSVTGRVSDEKGELMIGVSVLEKGTTNGTITDLNGQYNLNLSTENPVLVVSYIGYTPQEVKVGRQRVVDVILMEDVSALDEVVVVGYGSQRKVSVVGAQSTMELEQIKMPTANLSSAISGRIAGVVAVQRSGEPGHDGADIWIRGISTLLGQSSKPLVLVDGVERSFNNIDPEDIESFTVLKDASATAVYGVRGANGVVIVKTKPGRIGKPQFSVDFYQSFTRLTKSVDMADAYTYMDARNEAQRNTDGNIRYTDAYIEATKKANGLLPNENIRLINKYLYPAVDWADELFNDWGQNRRGNISVRGGAPNANYYVSLSYYGETGMTRNFKMENYNTKMQYDRYNFTTNLNLKPTSKTAVDLGVAGYLSQGHYPQSSTNELYAASMAINPVIYPLVLPDGSIPAINKDQLFSPYGMLARGGYKMEFGNTINSNLRVTQDLDFWKWSKGLSATAMVAFDVYNSRVLKYNRTEPLYQLDAQRGQDGLYLEESLFDDDGNYKYSMLRSSDKRLSYNAETANNRSIYVEASLNYDRTFGLHRVGGLFLYNQKEYRNTDADNKISDVNIDALIGSLPYNQRGFAFRGTYSWNDRYFAEFNLGINGSENFTPNKRYGTFPAFGVGWAVSNEAFWTPLKKYISFLKFRYTDGWVGSDTAAGRRFMYKGRFTSMDGTYFGSGYVSAPGYGESQYGVDISWSKSRKQDLGIDIKFLDDNLSLVVDIFKERRDNIFLQRSTIPNYAG